MLALTLGLLLSLIHCAGDGFAFAAAGATAAVTAGDPGTAPEMPDQQLPAHSGHCLSHVTAPSADVDGSPVDLPLCAPRFAGDQSPASLPGLPPFKPPRT